MINSTILPERLISSQLAQEETIVPATTEDIQDIELTANVSLPNEYKNFLKCCGRAAGVLFDDCIFYYPEVKNLNETARNMLTAFEGSKLQLPDGSFVFMYRNEVFFFFLCDNDNASGEVYEYYEDDRGFKKHLMDFWGFVEKELSSQEELFQKYGVSISWKKAHERAISRVKSLP